MKDTLRNYLVLWLASFIAASLAAHFLYGSPSVDFWFASTSVPTLDGRSVSVPLWRVIPLSEVWSYLIVSIAGGIILAKILTIIAQSAIAHHWKRTAFWLTGLFCLALIPYFVSLLAYPVGPWRKLGLIVFYNTRGPLGPTMVFATAIIVARLLSNAAQSNMGKRRLFLTLSGLAFASVLMMFAIDFVIPRPPMGLSDTFIALIIFDGMMYVTWAMIVVFAAMKLVIVAMRRFHTHAATSHLA